VRALLWAGADALAFNAGEALPLDLADTASPAWSLLEAELQWRTCLQVSNPDLYLQYAVDCAAAQGRHGVVGLVAAVG